MHTALHEHLKPAIFVRWVFVSDPKGSRTDMRQPGEANGSS